MKKMATAMVIAGLLPAMMSVGLGSAAAGTARCDEGHWPATVQGKPASFEPGGAAGYYVWHDLYGWHLRTTTPVKTPHSFTGKIVSNDAVKLVRRFHDEGRDTVTVSGKEISFSFVTYNGVDGIDFKVGCTEAVTFLLKAGGRYVPATRIWLGYRGTAPSNPFTIYRV